MSKLDVRDQAGKANGSIELPASIFEAAVNPAVLHQALVRQLANARQGTASTRTRSRVRGGGRKPYRQKGTGRARQGSLRAPQFVGGGTVFGPRPRSYAQDMPRKQRRLALRGALSARARENRLVVVETLAYGEPRTRDFVAMLAELGVDGPVLVVLDNHNLNAEKSARNIPGVTVLLSRNLNLRDVLVHDWLLMTRAAVDQLQEVLL